jgi:hypothetical protein
MDELRRRVTDSTGYHKAMEELDASFSLCPKFALHELTEEQIDEITTNAAQKAIELAKKDLYQGVGKAVVGWIFWIVGVAAIGLLVLAVKFGWIKP